MAENSEEVKLIIEPAGESEVKEETPIEADVKPEINIVNSVTPQDTSNENRIIELLNVFSDNVSKRLDEIETELGGIKNILDEPVDIENEPAEVEIAPEPEIEVTKIESDEPVEEKPIKRRKGWF